MRNLVSQKIVDSLAASVPPFTRRDVRLPNVQGKAVAVIGMRRTGKTTFLWQVLADQLAQGTDREGCCTSASRTSAWRACVPPSCMWW